MSRVRELINERVYMSLNDFHIYHEGERYVKFRHSYATHDVLWFVVGNDLLAATNQNTNNMVITNVYIGRNESVNISEWLILRKLNDVYKGEEL